MPPKPSPKRNVAVVGSLQTVGMRSLSRAVDKGLEEYHKTPGGRVVVLRFRAEGKERHIYLDQIGDTLRAPVPSEDGAFVRLGSGAKRSIVRRAPAKKSTKKAFKGTSRTKSIQVVATRAWGGDKEILLGKASAKIPKPIKEFTLFFFLNIRKIICPTGNKKVTISLATSGVVGSLAIWLVRTFGITNELAESFASTVLITIVTATKGAFCDMTAEMAKASLKKA